MPLPEMGNVICKSRKSCLILKYEVLRKPPSGFSGPRPEKSQV